MGRVTTVDYFKEGDTDGDGDLTDEMAVALAEYRYTGTATLAKSTLPSTITSHSVSGKTTPRDYANLDRFNRLVTSMWLRDNSATMGAADYEYYKVEIAYDRNSNITSIKDFINQDLGFSPHSAVYTYDERNRLTDAQEGNWSGSGIGTQQRDRAWGLDDLGNWSTFDFDIDGDGTNDFEWSRTHNNVNEITQFTDAVPSPADVFAPAHNDRGDMTDDGQDHKHVFDAFGRLVKITDRATPTPAVLRSFR